MVGLDTTIDLVSLCQALIVADQASFSGAANILGVRQSAVSRRIRALEDELGVSLFERQANGVRPTIAGRRFLERARVVFVELDNAAQAAMAAGRGVEGVIRIGVLPGTIPGNLGELLGDFRASHPRVAMEFFEGAAREQVGKIMERNLDVAFVVDGTAAYGCDVESFWTARIAVAMPDRHPLSGCKYIEWKFLKDEHFILGREAIGSGFGGLATERIAKLDGRMSSEAHDISQDAVMKLVALGFGLGIVGEGTASVHYPGIVFRPLPREESHLDYSAVWLPGNDNPALRRFLSLARSMTAERGTAKTRSSTRACGRSLAPSQNHDRPR